MLEAIQGLDAAVLLFIQDVLRLPVLNEIFLFFTRMGDGGFLWIVVSGLMLCISKTRKLGLYALSAMLLGFLVTNLTIKELVARPRPYETVLGALPLLLEHDPLSFPSGHTTAAFAAVGVWLRGVEKRWVAVLMLALAVLMGFSRMYIGVHYLSDVLTGAVIGLLCSQLVWMVSQNSWVRGEGRGV